MLLERGPEGGGDHWTGGAEKRRKEVVEIEAASTGGADDAGEDLLGVGPCGVRLPPHTLRATIAGRICEVPGSKNQMPRQAPT